jgi:hypothetical protein
MAADDPRVVLANRLVQHLDGGQSISTSGRIRAQYWRHQLFYRKFSINNVSGDIRRILLNCDLRLRELAFVPGEDVVVPAGSENCSIDVAGDPGTTFVLVERL